jgi:hypothetical protein
MWDCYVEQTVYLEIADVRNTLEIGVITVNGIQFKAEMKVNQSIYSARLEVDLGAR